MRSAELAPDVPVDAQGRPAPSVQLRHVDTSEVIVRYPIDARGMVASGEWEAVA
jgi:hypothetical protein